MTGTTVTKYYYAGSQRIAMRKNGALYYLLGNHLGSTGLTTDVSGQFVSELRYTAWGEVRYNSNVTPTNYTYTGQYSHTADFGLMFYQSRWYDPALGRFAQADSIVPGGVQGLDRYAYGLNNPSRYTDPSGHVACTDDGYCGTSNSARYWNKVIKEVSSDYGITFSGKWKQEEKLTVVRATLLTGTMLSNEPNNEANPADAFRAVYGLNDGDTFNFEWVDREQGPCAINGVTCWGYTPGANHIKIYETYNGIWNGVPYIANTPVSVGLVLHELGHAFNQRLGGAPMADLSGDLLTRPNGNHGFFADHYVGQFSHDTSQSEIFADMFLGYVLNRWGSNDLGDDRRDYMQGMNTWALNASQIP